MKGLWKGALCALVLAAVGASPAGAEFGGKKGYAGSTACRECHSEVYAQWRLTPHARMLVNAKKDPTAVLATDFNDDIPFSKGEIAYTVGSHWVQKYLTRIDGTLYVLPKYWNIPARKWEPYSIWNWREQPYNIFCDGCHAVGFDPATKSFFEPGVGCEACHGPGLKHVKSGGKLSAIVNPKKLPEDRALMICMACHTDGQDKETETFPFPAGFVPGRDLRDYFTDFFMPKPKSKAWYWGSMDLLERKRMYYFFQSKFYSTARACEVCGFDRGTSAHAERYMTRSEYCGTCHTKRWEKYFEHSGHRVEKAECVDCHVPKMAKPGRSYSIHDHKFDYSQPVPACTTCHEAKDVAGKTECGFEPKDHHLSRVKYPRELTVFEACLQCHKGKNEAWARRVTPGLVDRFIVEKLGDGS